MFDLTWKPSGKEAWHSDDVDTLWVLPQGIGIAETLETIVKRIPAPQDTAKKPLRALIFDSHYDSYKVCAEAHVQQAALHIEGIAEQQQDEHRAHFQHDLFVAFTAIVVAHHVMPWDSDAA